MGWSCPIAGRDWQVALGNFNASSPYNYTILDGFFEPEACRRLHRELLDHPDWKKQLHGDQFLFNLMRPKLPAIDQIAQQVMASCPEFFSGYRLLDHWVLLYPVDAPRKVHSDVGRLTLNIWMTPDEANLAPERGGLVFYDVKRPDPKHPEANSPYSWSDQFLNDHTLGSSETVSYRWNRAVLFDARTFHQTDELLFTNEGISCFRMNLSLTFDDEAASARVVG